MPEAVKRAVSGACPAQGIANPATDRKQASGERK
jgi:hypothetical protein